MNLGLKAVETGAEIADKVAAEADKVAGKAKEKWEKMCIRDRINVTLDSESKELEEVMVVAYATAKKYSFTGAASTTVSYTHLYIHCRFFYFKAQP